MPGTGKSTLLIALIKILLHFNKKILFTSYTHTSLDSVLDKLSEFKGAFCK